MFTLDPDYLFGISINSKFTESLGLVSFPIDDVPEDLPYHDKSYYTDGRSFKDYVRFSIKEVESNVVEVNDHINETKVKKREIKVRFKENELEYLFTRYTDLENMELEIFVYVADRNADKMDNGDYKFFKLKHQRIPYQPLQESSVFSFYIEYPGHLQLSN